MPAIYLLLGPLLVLLHACGQSVPAQPNGALGGTISTYGPDKHGVVCYRSTNTNTLSCVKVQP